MSKFVFFFKQKTAYEMRISDWSSDVCSSDLEKIAISAWATYQGPRNPSKEETHLRKPGLLGTPACEEQLARSVDLSDPPQLERCKRELGGNDRRVEAQFLQVLREHDRHGALEPLSSPDIDRQVNLLVLEHPVSVDRKSVAKGKSVS